MASMGTIKTDCVVKSSSKPRLSDSLSRIHKPKLIQTSPSTPPTRLKRLPLFGTNQKQRIGDGQVCLTTSISNMAVIYEHCPDPSGTNSTEWLIMNACVECSSPRKRWPGMIKSLLICVLIIMAGTLIYYVAYQLGYFYDRKFTNQLGAKTVKMPDEEGIALDDNVTIPANQQLVDIFTNRNSFGLTNAEETWNIMKIIQHALGALFGWMGSFFMAQDE